MHYHTCINMLFSPTQSTSWNPKGGGNTEAALALTPQITPYPQKGTEHLYSAEDEGRASNCTELPDISVWQCSDPSHCHSDSERTGLTNSLPEAALEGVCSVSAARFIHIWPPIWQHINTRLSGCLFFANDSSGNVYDLDGCLKAAGRQGLIKALSPDKQISVCLFCSSALCPLTAAGPLSPLPSPSQN